MEWISDPEDIARAKATFELYEFAEKTMRQNLRHRFPRESNEEIERRLVSWLRKESRERWDGPEPPTLSGLQPAKTVTRFEQALIRLSGDLQALGVRWALVGGMAVSFRAEPSRVQDIAVAVGSDPEAERITLSLKLRGYLPQPVQHIVEAALRPPAGSLHFREPTRSLTQMPPSPASLRGCTGAALARPPHPPPSSSVASAAAVDGKLPPQIGSAQAARRTAPTRTSSGLVVDGNLPPAR